MLLLPAAPLLLFLAAAPARGQDVARSTAPAAAPRVEPAVRRHRDRRKPRYGKYAKKKRGFELPAGRWAPEVKRALEALITRRGSGSPGYSADAPPVAVFSLEGAAAVHNAGEAAFYRMIDKTEFKFSKEFWDYVPPPFSRLARTGLGRFTALPQAVWPKDADFLMYRKALVQAYEEMCAAQGTRACRGFLVGLLQGYEEAEIDDYMKAVIDDSLQAPVVSAPVEASPGDERPVPMRTGLRKVPEMGALIRALLDHGFDVWMLSSANQWAAEALSSRYGVDPGRVVGVRCRVLNKKLIPEVVDPVPVGVGKVEAVASLLGRDPALAAGGPEDWDLLDSGKGLRLAVDAGDAAFAAKARVRGWLVQPAFSPGAPETVR